MTPTCDAEGHICVVASSPEPGMTTMTGYLCAGVPVDGSLSTGQDAAPVDRSSSTGQDAGGTRVAKGTITSWSCAPATNGFQTTSDYVIGLGGEQHTEMAVQPAQGSAPPQVAWLHTNVWAGGKLLGTYDKDGLHFYFDDPLGTRRAQTDAAGVLEQSCVSLPYGDDLNCSGQPQSDGILYTASLSEPTENHFTGKERDVESGNDYFGARYYASTMGRFLSPDWSAKEEPVPYATMGDPQSLNLYAYMRNNPLGGVDADGHGPLEDFISWVAVGVATEGGGGFSRNVGIGALKGIGQAAYTLGSMASNSNNPGGFAADMINMPAAITPSNTTQAQVAFVTSTTISVAATLPAALEVESAEVAAEIPEVASEAFIVRGGTSPMPSAGTTFSASQGATLEEAAAGVPHGTIRTTTTGAIREGGGTVESAPELTK